MGLTTPEKSRAAAYRWASAVAAAQVAAAADPAVLAVAVAPAAASEEAAAPVASCCFSEPEVGSSFGSDPFSHARRP